MKEIVIQGHDIIAYLKYRKLGYRTAWAGGGKICLIQEAKLKCDCCGINEATCIDWREQYEVLSKYKVCARCLHRTDRSFFAKMKFTQRRNNGIIKKST